MMLKKILSYFYEIGKIPRPSKKEKKIKNYIINWANNSGFNYKEDTIGNLIIYIPATQDKINSQTVILQGHLDMVCVKDDLIKHDFENDSLEIFEENGFLKAKGTTLGADNGVGIAIAMVLAESDSHPALELLFTVDEEEGLGGALNLDGSLLYGRKLINLDSEELGEICISSAGGARINIDGKLNYINGNFNQYKIYLTGLKGGHSGVDIDKKRGNAIYFMINFLKNYDKKFELVSIKGGTACNAIPGSCEIIIGIYNKEDLETKLNFFLKQYLINNDCPDINYKIERITDKQKIIENQKLILQALYDINVGVYNISNTIKGLVNSSVNLGIIDINEELCMIDYMPRSSISKELDDIIGKIKKNYENINFIVNVSSIYPGWQENPDNELVKLVYDEYKKIYDKAKLTTIHAGLECGVLVEKIGNGCQAISIGPTIISPHSTQETCEISSIEKIYELVEKVLKNI